MICTYTANFAALNKMLTVVAMDITITGPLLFNFAKGRCLLMTLRFIVYHAFFTKLCMSKVQYVCGEHMTSYKCVTSFGSNAAILFSA